MFARAEYLPTAVLTLAAVTLTSSCAVFAAVEWTSGKVWPEPKVVDPGPAGPPTPHPDDAIVLFDGTDMSAFKNADKWEVKDGAVTTAAGDVSTKREFGDCQLHVEFATPTPAKGKGQGRGNSGVKLMERYELQVLDSYNNTTYFDGQCGAIYKQHPPLVNACRKPGEWQTYDIWFSAPRFADDGSVREPAYITVFQNGILIQDHFAIEGTTEYDRPPKYEHHPAKAPLLLQYHNNKVRYRNIWIREVTPMNPTEEKKS